MADLGWWLVTRQFAQVVPFEPKEVIILQVAENDSNFTRLNVKPPYKVDNVNS